MRCLISRIFNATAIVNRATHSVLCTVCCVVKTDCVIAQQKVILVSTQRATTEHPSGTEGRTICLRGRGSSPFLDAVQVEDVEAALAAPHWGHDPNDITAHHALILLLRQLLD